MFYIEALTIFKPRCGNRYSGFALSRRFIHIRRCILSLLSISGSKSHVGSAWRVGGHVAFAMDSTAGLLCPKKRSFESSHVFEVQVKGCCSV